MATSDVPRIGDGEELGREMHALMRRLYPICRSITGEGVRSSLAILQEIAPIEVREVASGSQVFDWKVPKEWNPRAAYIRAPDGSLLGDFRESNLHLVSYSVPVHRTMPLAELREHLHSLPEHPDWIPYRTSYYRETWGFCLPHRVVQALAPGDYEVMVDVSLADGSLTFGELALAGESEDEVLISTHVCHPSLCNDNLSGMLVVAHLARLLAAAPRRYTYRFLFLPGTIGSITWLALHEERAEKIRHGLVAANLGDGGPFTYKRSRHGDREIDRAAEHVLAASGAPYEIQDFVPFGYDERQYCSPGFDLAVGSLTRTPWGRYPEYHTSADDLDFVKPRFLTESLGRYLEVIEVLEGNRRYLNLNPKCEPQLGRRGLYRTLGGDDKGRERELAMLWVLNLSDGEHDLLDIARRSSLSFPMIRAAADALEQARLLREA